MNDEQKEEKKTADDGGRSEYLYMAQSSEESFLRGLQTLDMTHMMLASRVLQQKLQDCYLDGW